MTAQSIQTTFSHRSAVAYPGLIVACDPDDILSLVAEGAVEFGLACFRGTDPDDQVKISGANPAAAYIMDTASSVWSGIADQLGKTFYVQIDDQTSQLIDLSMSGTVYSGIAVQTATAAVGPINSVIEGAIASASANRLTLTALNKGGTIKAFGGTTAITWSTPVKGTDSKFVGIAVRDHAAAGGPSGTYNDEEVAGVMVKGTIWVSLETTGNPGDLLTVDIATGRIGTTAPDATHAKILNAKLMNVVAATDGLAQIKLS